jgi:hypothetical protein
LINYHHLGGRSGTYPLPLKDTIFCKDVNLTLYEADRECIEQIKAKENNAFGKVNVIPYCVSSRRGVGDFILIIIQQQTHFTSSMKTSKIIAEYLNIYLGSIVLVMLVKKLKQNQ